MPILGEVFDNGIGQDRRHKPPNLKCLPTVEIGGSPDFHLEPDCRISQANRHIAGSNHLTGLNWNQKVASENDLLHGAEFGRVQ